MSKKNVWISTVLVLALLTAALLFIGCELDSSRTDLAESASRSLSSVGGPAPFTAVVFVEQRGGYKTERMGEGDRWRTTEEVLEGEILFSSWDDLKDKQVVMSNFTNFHFFIDGYDNDTHTPYGNVSGTNHSSIEIVEDCGSTVMTMKANGKLAGIFPVFADLDMNFSSTGPGPNVRGELSGTFFWSDPSQEMVEDLQNELKQFDLSLPKTDSPFGIFVLTGVYR